MWAFEKWDCDIKMEAGRDGEGCRANCFVPGSTTYRFYPQLCCYCHCPLTIFLKKRELQQFSICQKSIIRQFFDSLADEPLKKTVVLTVSIKKVLQFQHTKRLNFGRCKKKKKICRIKTKPQISFLLWIGCYQLPLITELILFSDRCRVWALSRKYKVVCCETNPQTTVRVMIIICWFVTIWASLLNVHRDCWQTFHMKTSKRSCLTIHSSMCHYSY